MTQNSRPFRSILLICSVLLLSGCIKNKILIKVKSDGSGNIVITRIFSKEVVAMFQAQMSEMKEEYQSEEMGIDIPENPFYNEKMLKREALMFGPGVTFVEAREYTKAGARGSIAVYSFTDINDIFVNLESMGPENQMSMAYGEMEDDDEVAEKEDDAFEFSLVKGQVNKLRILCPDYPEIEPEEEAEEDTEFDESVDESMPSSEVEMLMAGGNPFGFTGNETQAEAVQRMFKGTLVSLAVEVDGTLVKSDASYQHGSKKERCILAEIDMDELMSSPAGRKVLNPMEMAQYSSPVDFFASVRNLPGLKIETKKAVNVEFK
jgi:hypothetical protein